DTILLLLQMGYIVVNVDGLLEHLSNRARALLLNPELITDELLAWAYEETLECAQGKEVPSFALYDFALMRLKRLLKMPFSDEDALIYENARKVLENATISNVERAPLPAPSIRF
ncbi:hypothetical protein ACFOPX_04760, partial [Helicobacter baculiformis]